MSFEFVEGIRALRIKVKKSKGNSRDNNCNDWYRHWINCSWTYPPVLLSNEGWEKRATPGTTESCIDRSLSRPSLLILRSLLILCRQAVEIEVRVTNEALVPSQFERRNEEKKACPSTLMNSHQYLSPNAHYGRNSLCSATGNYVLSY